MQRIVIQTLRFQSVRPIMTTIGERLTNLNSEIGLVTMKDHYKSYLSKVGRDFFMVVVSMLPHAEIGRNDHQKSAPTWVSSHTLVVWMALKFSSNPRLCKFEYEMIFKGQRKNGSCQRIIQPKTYFSFYLCDKLLAYCFFQLKFKPYPEWTHLICYES